MDSLDIAIARGVARTSESIRTDRSPSVYRMPVRPRTLTENPVLLSITFGSGSEKCSAILITNPAGGRGRRMTFEFQMSP